MEKLFRVQEAADILRVSKSGLYAMVASKKIGHVRLGCRVLFREGDLERFVEENAYEA